MGNINAVVDLRQDGGIALIQMQNAPVNALGFDLRYIFCFGLRSEEIKGVGKLPADQ